MPGFRYYQPAQPIAYTANGSEGFMLNLTLVPGFIPGLPIRLVTRNSIVLLPEDPIVDSIGYSYDPFTTVITFATPLDDDEVIQIIQ